MNQKSSGEIWTGIGYEQMRVSIEAAEEGEVGVERRDVGVEGVVDLDGDDVVRADADIRCDVKDESRETALMFAERIAVDPNVRDGEGGVEFQKEMAAGVVGGNDVVGAIPADAAVISAAVLAVEVIPGVGEA